MGEDKGTQQIGLFNIPIGDKKWFAEHTRRHHHHHHKGNTGSGEHTAKESEPTEKK